ncbi:MAG: hypothetical protein U9O83_08025 [Campylobacterota bacterium]|nr:hypothetical protein [Campylobacterota bacterium]
MKIVFTGLQTTKKVLEILHRANIKMYVGAEEMSLKKAYEVFKANTLVRF